jgi:histidinol phosphatase-like PHP family hydrolase
MRIATHVHSHYSFDCETSINAIISSCKERDINAILITDHDVFSLTVGDLELFKINDIFVIPAIEFTTREGAHIIGAHPNIKQLEADRFSYSCKEIVSAINEIKGWSIIVHPTHSTGVLGTVISKEDLDFVFSNSDFIEAITYKYGKFNIDDKLKEYTNLTAIISDDAHKATEIGMMLNIIENKELCLNCDVIFSAMKENSSFSILKIKVLKKKMVKLLLSNNMLKNLVKLIPVSLRATIKKTLGGY